MRLLMRLGFSFVTKQCDKLLKKGTPLPCIAQMSYDSPDYSL